MVQLAEGKVSKVYDLLILTDATSSMGSYIKSLNESLPEIIRISALTGCFARIGVTAYRDYCGGQLTEWSGWYVVSGPSTDHDDTTSREGLLKFAAGLRAEYGGDWPEATKTGLALCHEKMNSSSGTILVLYTDAPAHTMSTQGANWTAEQAHLKSSGRAQFADWVSAANALRDKKAQVFSIIKSDLGSTISQYAFLSCKTGGICLALSSLASGLISRLTVELLLAWMGAEKTGAQMQEDQRLEVDVAEYESGVNVDTLRSEKYPICEYFFGLDMQRELPAKLSLRKLSYTERMEYVSSLGRRTRKMNFSMRYKLDPVYRELVVENLKEIMESDVQILTVNPVFGSLWRAVCNDRENAAREDLTKLFGMKVEQIKNLEQRARMKIWLEESYNYEAEILEIIREVSESESFPCVYLDPTTSFDGDEEDNGNLTRAELLEIGRSCDPRILRRMGRILTQLTYITRKEDLPAHIVSANDEIVPRIPMALTKSKYKRKFWKILLHTVTAGTILAPRPAALLAALSLRMGIAPLRAAADAELSRYQNWNTLEYPETWNVGCLSLLLDADKDFEGRKQPSQKEKTGVLKAQDRWLFQTLVDYKMLEANLQTTLYAKIGWDPDKNLVSIGPLVTCKRCQFARSVTMMSDRNICGLCAYEPDGSLPDLQMPERLQANVSKHDDETTKISWVECRLSDCRAQYVVYNPDALNVVPKCHYCRKDNRAQGARNPKAPSAPLVECKRCQSRIIWPTEYRPTGFETRDYNCPACVSGCKTIVEVETNAKKLLEQNGSSWLIESSDTKLYPLFSGRTIFHIISTSGSEGFADKLKLFPKTKSSVNIGIQGKPIHNTTEVLSSLESFVRSRHTESVTCSLCFSDFKHHQLRTACGRKGCQQDVCSACHRRWYGQNERGCIINVAALSCPFCRRLPASSTVSAYQINVLGDLRSAVDEAGTWIYAWCLDCGFARQFMERNCQIGPPEIVEAWSCETCEASKSANHSTSVLKIRKCPGCGISSMKAYGCDHITCPKCNTHWCWTCGKSQDETNIYTHMVTEHGTIYFGQEDENEWDYQFSDGDSDAGFIQMCKYLVVVHFVYIHSVIEGMLE